MISLKMELLRDFHLALKSLRLSSISALKFLIIFALLIHTHALPKRPNSGNSAADGRTRLGSPKVNDSGHQDVVIPAVPAGDVVTSCKAYIEKFSEMASNFTKCTIKNARPVKFCEFCVKDYVAAKSIYDKIMEVSKASAG